MRTSRLAAGAVIRDGFFTSVMLTNAGMRAVSVGRPDKIMSERRDDLPCIEICYFSCAVGVLKALSADAGIVVLCS